MRTFLIGVVFLSMVGCSQLTGFLPDKFDSTEYGALVELAVVSENTKDCNTDAMEFAWAKSAFLQKYSEHTMNDNNSAIYVQIHDLVNELKVRQEPSTGYCRIKWGNISSIVEEALVVSGSRMK